jgi:hypothetical protein
VQPYDMTQYPSGPCRTMRRGDSFVFDVQVFQAPLFGSPPGNPTPPQNITGWFMWFTAKYYVTDPDTAAVAQCTSTPASVPVGGGIVFLEPTIGRAEITMPPLATRAFPDGPVALVCDVQVQDPSSRIFTVETSRLVVLPDVTRAIAPVILPPPVPPPAGAVEAIQTPVGLGTVSSADVIPVGALVLRACLVVKTAYSAGTTVTLGQAGTPVEFMGPADSLPPEVGSYETTPILNAASSSPLLVTVAGGPSVGAAVAIVEYVPAPGT